MFNKPYNSMLKKKKNRKKYVLYCKVWKEKAPQKSSFLTEM